LKGLAVILREVAGATRTGQRHGGGGFCDCAQNDIISVILREVEGATHAGAALSQGWMLRLRAE
jgi:hypothetical protein